MTQADAGALTPLCRHIPYTHIVVAKATYDGCLQRDEDYIRYTKCDMTKILHK